MEPPRKILLVEDHPPDAKLIRRVLLGLKTRVVVESVSDGMEALLYLRRVAPYETAEIPDLILLDLNLPKVSGLEVLEAVKGSEDLHTVPVIILTGSDAHRDVECAFRRRCNAYIIKPGSPEKLRLFAETLERHWFILGRLP